MEKEIKLGKSSNIKKALYNDKESSLLVYFQTGNGTPYKYYDVSPSEIEEWQKADSVGSWFVMNIARKKEYRKWQKTEK